MKTMIDPEGWMPLEEAAEVMRTTGLHLLMRVKRGLVRGRELNGRWYIDPAAVSAAASTPDAGEVLRPTHCKKPGGCGGCG